MQALSNQSAPLSIFGLSAREQYSVSNGFRFDRAYDTSSAHAESVMSSQRLDPSTHASIVPQSNRTRRTIPSFTRRHSDARSALRQIEERHKALAAQQRHMEEMRWIETNRSNYIGQWVALIGAQLLASGSTAKEVFQKASAVSSTAPLLTRIDEDALPFAGW